MTMCEEFSHSDRTLDPGLCQRARLSRDPRFDGIFFVGVRTTGIYCRPVCPARLPAEKNVVYYASATKAGQDGFRPCLRCRPESAPNSPAWLGTSSTLRRAVKLIDEGALNTGNVPQLAERLGIGERYLRKLFQRELGISPSAHALNQRLLFAKKLLAETALPVTDVAFAAGFGSVRRFNSAIKKQFRLSPTRLRRAGGGEENGARIRLQLNYRPPYDWKGVINYFSRHAVNGVEEVDENSYRRKIRHGDSPGLMTIRPIRGENSLLLELEQESHNDLMLTVSRVRRMFDLDANPTAIAEVLEIDSCLKPLVKKYPGIRSPGNWTLEETAIRAVVGQQISTKAARSVLARMAQAAGQNNTLHGFPDALAVGQLEDDCFAMPGSRRATLRDLCTHCASPAAKAESENGIETLATIKGIGLWTTAMIAMRGAGSPDIWPPRDLGLLSAYEKLGGEGNVDARAAAWGPWRSYAANLLWRSLGT